MEQELTTEGVIFMALGWGFVIYLLVFTISKVLKSGDKPEENISKKDAES